MKQIEKELYGEVAMLEYGEYLATQFTDIGVVYLQGDLGMGKTTLVRGFLKGCGYIGAVKSPTYTIVEPYEIALKSVYHFDLYRLNDPEELEYIGIRDYFDRDSLALIEWPDKGGEYLPSADLVIHISFINDGRKIIINAISDKGKSLLKVLA